MSIGTILSLVGGILFGKFLFNPNMTNVVDTISTVSLSVLVLSVGIDIGNNKEVFKNIYKYHVKILIIPFGIVIGSLLGGFIAGQIFSIEPAMSAAISSGLGWYSFSGVFIDIAGQSQMASVYFLANIFRELLAFLLIPIIAKYLNKLSAIAPSGATAMDTTLPVISKHTNEETAIIAVVTGVICTGIVPFLVPMFLSFAS